MCVAIAAGALAAGGAIYSANKSSNAAAKARKTANRGIDVSQQLLDQTDPLRQQLIDRSQNFLGSGGGLPDVLASAPYLAYKDAANANFARARDNIMANTPTGGSLTSALGNLEANRASTLTQGAGQLYDNETARALGLATGQVPTALNGLSMGGNTQALLAGAQAQQSSAKASSLGSAAGSYLGGKGSGTGTRSPAGSAGDSRS